MTALVGGRTERRVADRDRRASHGAPEVVDHLALEAREHQRLIVTRFEVLHHFGKQLTHVNRALPQHAIEVVVAKASGGDATRAKLDAARTLAMEADLDDPQIADMLAPTDRSLRRELGEQYWHQLEDALGPGMAAAVDHLPTMVTASALSSRGLPPTPPMDKVLRDRASETRKRLVYLEPATRQLAILRKWLDVRALKLILDELPDAERRAQAMLSAYLAGDDQQLVALADGERDQALHHGYSAAEYERELAEMLYDRNVAWLAAIEGVHAEGGGFVAVGALHLVGPHSVLALLGQRGYRVTRVGP